MLLNLFVFITYVTSFFAEDPQCGIPMVQWTQYFLFLKGFRSVHNLIGLLMVLSNSITTYRPNVKILMFFILETFEFLWYVYGAYEYFIDNKCPVGSKSNYFYNNVMFFSTMWGFIFIFNFIIIGLSIALEFFVQFMNDLKALNFRILVLRQISKFKFRTSFYHGELECIICWGFFQEDEYVTRLNCSGYQ